MAELNFNDFFGLGKGLEKLLEIISKGLGRVTKAHFDRIDAESKALELRK
jgi:hypothetical protein